MYEDILAVDILVERGNLIGKLSQTASEITDKTSPEYEVVLEYLVFIAKETMNGYKKALEEHERQDNISNFTGPKEVH